MVCVQKVAVLFVDPNGPYPLFKNIVWWDEQKDARSYKGPWPVVAHPPCGRWCGMARMNEKRWGAKVGEDGDCFKFALQFVRQFGGVLEHPARSIAWEAFNLQKPTKIGWNRVNQSEYVAEVWQSAYGHKATKRTWLLYCGDNPPLPFLLNRPRGTHQIGGGVHTGNRLLPRLNQKETHISPQRFAKFLVALARNSKHKI